MHQVGDQTKAILRCTVNQPSIYNLSLNPGKEETLWEI